PRRESSTTKRRRAAPSGSGASSCAAVAPSRGPPSRAVRPSATAGGSTSSPATISAIPGVKQRGERVIGVARKPVRERQAGQPGERALSARVRPQCAECFRADAKLALLVEDVQALAHEFLRCADLLQRLWLRMDVDPLDVERASGHALPLSANAGIAHRAGAVVEDLQLGHTRLMVQSMLDAAGAPPGMPCRVARSRLGW